MKSKLQEYKAELAELMETKNDPDTPKDIKDAIEPAIKKLNLLITGLAIKNMQSKVSKAPSTSKKESKAPSPAKKSSDADLKRCKEILAKYNDKKKTDAKRVEKRKRAGKPVELTPSETIKKAAKSVKTKVVEMDKGLKVSEEASIIRGILDSVVSAMSGIKDSYRKKMFIGKIIEGLRKLEKSVSMKTAEDGMYLHQIHGGELEDSNAEMLRLNLIEIKHHVDEISEALNNVGDVEGWVLSRSVRAKTDMSDIAHYVDSTSKVRTMADGGMMAKGGKVYVDLFEERDEMPYKVNIIVDKYEEEYGEDISYQALLDMQREVEEVGYTFDFGLDSIPYGLRPIGVDITQLDGYDGYGEDEMAMGGMMADGGKTKDEPKVIRGYSDDEAYEYAKGGMTSTKANKIFEEYEENEDNNAHSENVVLLAKHFGNESDLRDAKTILAKHEAIGNLPSYLMQERDALSKKLYPKLIEAKNKMASGGMMAKGGIYSSENLYIVKVFDGKSGELLDMSHRVFARNLKEADRIAKEDFEYEMKGKYGDYLRFRVEEAPQFAADGGMTAGRGRLLSALNRDRAYTSSQEWEKNYKRKGRPKKPKYNTSYALGGQAKVKQYPDLSNNKPTVIN